MAGGISFTGLSSNLDTDSIITALTQAETTRKTTLANQQTTLKLRQTAYTTIKGGMTAISRAAGALNSPTAWNTIAATSTDETVATITGSSTASQGAYDLKVTNLAKANKIGSSPQADTTSALGKSGSVSVNGKAFSIDASDSLTAIAKKVNALSSGVTASVVDGGAGRAYLTFSSSNTGSANSVSLTDLSGTSFKDLGLIGSGATVRSTDGNTATGNAYSTSSGSIQSVLGATGLTASNININGTDISVDPSTDSMDDLANRINNAGISGVTATVQADVQSGSTVYSLKITGSAGTPTMSETGGVLRGLGVLRSTPANELVAAQDAKYSLDGVDLTSPTNTITTAITGATLTLKKADSTASLTLTQDTSGIKTNVNALVSSVNDLLSTIASQSTFDSKTFDTGVLFGDSVAQNAKNAVRNLLFTDSPGVTGQWKNLASIGVGLDTDGNVTLDSTIFDAAMAKDPAAVASLFQATGSGSNSSLKYVSATTKAVASSSSGYDVNITQAATKASFVAGTAQTSARTSEETLTFRGTGFGTNGIALTMESGTDLAATVAKINGDGRLKDLVSASIQDGKLRIDSKRFGASGNFTLTSNYSSTGSNSGVGVGGEGAFTSGLDIAGTINGEAASGSGQFLIGKTGNATTEGLQIQYTGTTTGKVGTVNYSRGAASRLIDTISGFTDSITGSLAAADKGLQNQIDGLDADMTTIDDRITSKTAELKAKFAAMEDALAKLKNDSSTVSSMLGTS